MEAANVALRLPSKIVTAVPHQAGEVPLQGRLALRHRICTRRCGLPHVLAVLPRLLLLPQPLRGRLHCIGKGMEEYEDTAIIGEVLENASC